MGAHKVRGHLREPQGLIFVDIGNGECLVIETRGERFQGIVQVLEARANALAHEIMQAIPDSEPTE